jgi:hypothetical protein
MAGSRKGCHDDADADGLNWELTPQQSAGFGRGIAAALARDLAVAAKAAMPGTGRSGRSGGGRPGPAAASPAR